MYYCKRGVLADKPFTVLLAENGAATHEEMVTSSGFDGPSSLLYRLRAATEVDRIELVQDRPLVAAPGTLRNHQVRVEHIGATGAFWEAREPLFYNADLVYSVARPAPGDTTFYRNAHCDELLIVVNGTGRVDSAFGSLSYEPLDMLYVPRGTTIQVDADTDRQLLVVLETRSPLGPPPRAMGARGQMRYNAMYQERDIRLPEYLGARDDEAAHEV